MSDLPKRIESYYVTSYDVLLNTLNELLIQNDITYVSLWIVFFIVIILSSLIIAFKKKQDEVLSVPEATTLKSINRCIDIIKSNEENYKVMNYKQLLEQLHYLANKCYDSYYASKCIRLVRDCPHLINVSLEPSGLTPFQLVCYHGHTCLVEYMLAKGANPLLMTRSGENALCLAMYHYIKHPDNQDLSCLDVLFKSGCTLDPESRYFKVILKMAIQSCHKHLTEWILIHCTKTAVSNYRSMSVPLALKNIKNYSHCKPRLRH